MNALNAIETATNALASVNWELQDELNDADLMAISGGGGSLVNVGDIASNNPGDGIGVLNNGNNLNNLGKNLIVSVGGSLGGLV
ncbi:MAG: hypothetical protein KME46_09290 [Brasilonema angustatum HA4187-MV1]|jgi:hypothetical protein|nr:hypothetical protein [Brasilonema angustatum HA4187-MV1]